MTISSLSSLDYYTTTSSLNKTNQSSQTNPLKDALASLESDLKSGDTTDASSLLTSILSNAPTASSDSSTSSSSSSSGSSSVGDSITSYLQSLQSAVSSGDTTSAEDILSKLKEYLAANAPDQKPVSGTYSSDGTVTSASSSANSALSALI